MGSYNDRVSITELLNMEGRYYEYFEHMKKYIFMWSSSLCWVFIHRLNKMKNTF